MTLLSFCIYTFAITASIIGAFLYHEYKRGASNLKALDSIIVTALCSFTILYVVYLVNDRFELIRLSDKEKQEVKVEEKPTYTPKVYKSTLLGKWKVNQEGISYIVEIYERDGEHYSYVDYGEGNSSRETLDKVGNKFYVSGSSVGDYYLLDGSTLHLGDNDGIIYSATTQWIE